MDLKEYVDTNEAAAIMGCTDGRVRQLLIEGELPGVKVNKRAWLAERKAVEKRAKLTQTKGRPNVRAAAKKSR